MKSFMPSFTMTGVPATMSISRHGIMRPADPAGWSPTAGDHFVLVERPSRANPVCHVSNDGKVGFQNPFDAQYPDLARQLQEQAARLNQIILDAEEHVKKMINGTKSRSWPKNL